VVLFLLGGRLIRHRMLLGPDGAWRDDLWLDGLLADPAAAVAEEAPRPVLTDPLPINSCSADSLELLPRVGPVLAGRIAAARMRGVVFRTPADLEIVKGIGPAMSARLAPLVVFAPDSAAVALPDTAAAPADTLSAAAP
jgi:predicted flap endonuclease-1-like 5' DNA nuclease